MPNNKDRNPNKNRKQNQNQEPYQNQNPDNNDMRGEFGSTFDVDQLKTQKNNNRTRNNNDLDPGKRNF